MAGPNTIFARSSGAAPSAIGIIRISGPEAELALRRLAGGVPEPRRASLRTLSWQGSVLDHALVLWFPGPATATGEDCAELHCHGGRAVLAAVENALGEIPGLRQAEAGEFTRRAFFNGRMDLAQAEGLGDLLMAETELQRRVALEAAGGHLSREIEEWRQGILGLSAELEAAMDFADEGDVSPLGPQWRRSGEELLDKVAAALARPPAERLRDGIRVVLAGPPNAGKSSLFNAILQEPAAIVTAEAGTTRDALERSISLRGIPFVMVDTAGLRSDGAGEIERMGIERAEAHVRSADIVLWLGRPEEAPEGSLVVRSKSDLAGDGYTCDLNVSAVTGFGVEALLDSLVSSAQYLLPAPGTALMNARQRQLGSSVANHLRSALSHSDALLAAEELRLARVALDEITGRAGTEKMLDTLFGRFCIGK